MRPKRRNDKNHGKNGWIGGNPRWGKHDGNFRGDRCRQPKLEMTEMTEVQARIAEVKIRTVTVSKALLKQCRVFIEVPPNPFCEIVQNDEARQAYVQVLKEHAVGWFRGTVLGDDDHDYVLFAKDGDLLLGKFWKTMQRWKLPAECKQLYF